MRQINLLLTVVVSSTSIFLQTREKNLYPSVEDVREFASAYYGASSIGEFSYSLSVRFDTPSSTSKNGRLFVFSSNMGYVFGESNDFYGSVHLNNDLDLRSMSECTYNAYSGSLVNNGMELSTACLDDVDDSLSPNSSNQIIGDKDKPLDAYIKEKYGDNCKFDCSATLKYQGTTQYELSNYMKAAGDKTFMSEPNCFFAASYHVFEYLAQSKPTIFPRSLLEDSPYILASEEPEMYGYYLQRVNDGYAIRDGISRVYNGDTLFDEIKNRSNLYRSLRKASFETKSDWYSAKITGLDIWQSSQMAERFANEYGIEGFNSWEDTRYNSYVGTQAFKDNFEKNSNPIIFATSTGVYGSHQIAVFGYRFYKLSKKVLWFDVTEWKCILDVLDGWSADRRYFDITDYNGNIGAFVNYGYDE